jgi:addiction module HigA family antidote
MRIYDPGHPGRVVKGHLGEISVTAAAKHLCVTRAALSRILNGHAGISAEMALRLADAFGTSPQLWTSMQAEFDLWQASKKHRKLRRLVSD